MKKIYVECPQCHYTFSTRFVEKFSELIMNDTLYKCKGCNNVMYFYDVHICSRQMGNEVCNTCRFRFLCYTNDATKEA